MPGMERFLRDWRQDALNKAQYDAAIFVGDKLLALTNDDNDAFWLAQVHFATGNYTRAQMFLAKKDLISRNVSCRYLAGHCLVKQGRYDEALTVLGERNPTHLILPRSNYGIRAATGFGGATGAGSALGSNHHGNNSPHGLGVPAAKRKVGHYKASSLSIATSASSPNAHENTPSSTHPNASTTSSSLGNGASTSSSSSSSSSSSAQVPGSLATQASSSSLAQNKSLLSSIPPHLQNQNGHRLHRNRQEEYGDANLPQHLQQQQKPPADSELQGPSSSPIIQHRSVDDIALTLSDAEAATRRYEAAMCYLRGVCYAKQNAFDRAKTCYKDAVSIDVQCFEAFQQLMKNSLLSPEEEWEFLESLDFESIRVTSGSSSTGNTSSSLNTVDLSLLQEAAEFTKMLYTTQLSKYRNPSEFETAYESLATHYRLADNPDLLLARADLLFTQCRYREALALTESVLREDKYNFSIYPIHLACLYELKKKNVLFLIAHDLADAHPENPCTWLAVGIYYFSIQKIAEARRFFSKASMMDTHFGPAWIGFAHTFAAEGEHDQAISAYSTAARLFMGTHLPQLFLGMQHHALSNFTLAEEFLKTAYDLCKTDPLLINEMGVVKFHQDQLAEAVLLFQRALLMADEIGSEPDAWVAARTNLGHAYRRMRHFDQAVAEFDEVLRLGGKDPAVFAAKGLIFLEQGRPDEAIPVLHEALAVHPQDPIATELLNKALDETILVDSLLDSEGGSRTRRANQSRPRQRARDRSGDEAYGGGGDSEEVDMDEDEDERDDDEDDYDAEEEEMIRFEEDLEQQKAQLQQARLLTAARAHTQDPKRRNKGKGIPGSS